jgi:WD40 repeat protein
VTAGSDIVMSVWDTAAGSMLNYIPSSATYSTVTSLAFSPSGTTLAAALSNSILVWNTTGYSLLTTLNGHTQPVEAVAFSPDGTLLASASTAPEQVVKLWSTQTWALVRTLTGASNGLRSVQFSPDGTKVVAAGDDGIAREWNVTTGAVVHSYLATGQGAMRIQYSPDGTKLAAGWLGKVLLFNEGTSTPFQTLLAHTQNNTQVVWSPDGKRLISGNPDGTVDIWDTTTWGQLSQYNSETYAQGGGILSLAYSPDNSQFAYGRADSVVVAVDTGNAPSGIVTTVTTNPQGLNMVVDEATTASPQTFRWLAGTTHTIGVPSPQGSSGTRNVFESWSDAGSQSHTITTPSTSSTYTAQFNPQYLLTPAVSPGASGSILVTPTSTDGYYDAGTTVQAVASANLGYVFGTWSGAASGTTNPASVTMSAPESIAANFSALPTTVVTTNPPGLQITVDGTQYTGPQSFNWTVGSSHTLAIILTQGARALRYAFNTWSDGGAVSHTITAPAISTTYIANYNTQYPLAANSNPSGGGTITASPTAVESYYNSGSPVQVTAVPATGYTFTSWSGDVTGTASQQSLNMSTAHSVTANFTAVAVSPCDLNQNGSINVVDVQALINEALGVASAINDLNGDGVVNVLDVQIVANAALNLGCTEK